MRSLLCARNSGQWLVLIVWGSLAGCTVEAQFGLITREEALASAFPDATAAAERIFLTDEQAERIETIARVVLDSKLYARYIVSRSGVVVGRAYVDTHQVRTKKESLLICLDAKGLLRRIEVTAFREPPEYMVSDRFYAQYHGKALSNSLSLQRSIRPVAGATLTTKATNQAVRRILAIDQVLRSHEGSPL